MNKNKTKSRFLPYEADYELLDKWRLVGIILLYIVTVLSILIPIISNMYKSYILLYNILGFTSYLSIISYYVVNVVTEIFLYPATARLRRTDFIDNSLGSKFLGKKSENYFTNDSIQPGAYKMTVNCFENCFFTYNIARGMNITIISKNIIFSSAFLFIAYVGLKENLIALPILQILLSSLFMNELIHHLNFVVKLNSMLERFRWFFMEIMNNKLNPNDLQHPTLLLLEYETTLAYNKSPLSNKVYKKLKEKLSAEWEELKEYYEIIK
jgi:hypothetical protein